jgi:hypothetical protein
MTDRFSGERRLLSGRRLLGITGQVGDHVDVRDIRDQAGTLPDRHAGTAKAPVRTAAEPDAPGVTVAAIARPPGCDLSTSIDVSPDAGTGSAHTTLAITSIVVARMTVPMHTTAAVTEHDDADRRLETPVSDTW